MIRLKTLLEQLGGNDAVFKQAPIDKSIVITPFNAKKVAKLLYNSKGYLNDDESVAKNSITKNIKNVTQYAQVNKELKALTSGKGIGEYLRSFLNNVDRFEIVRSLVYILPKSDWNWTIANIVPFSDFKLLISKNPSYWDTIVGNSLSGQPASKTELQLIQFYKPERDRDEFDYNRVWAKPNITLTDIMPYFLELDSWSKTLPLHLRCFYEFICGRTKTLTESDLRSDEREFLIKCSLEHGLNNGFQYRYWKSIGASGALSLSAAGSEAEKEKYGIKSMFSPTLPTSFMYTFGEIAKGNVYKSGAGTIVVKDNYDFNSREYNMSKEEILKEFTDTLENFKKGKAAPYTVVRKAANLRELAGYNGFPVNIILRYTPIKNKK